MMGLGKIGYAANDMRTVSAADLVRMAVPGVDPGLFDTRGWGYLMKLRLTLAQWVEEKGRLPVDGESDEIVEAVVAATGERYVWEVFVAMSGWRHEDAEGKPLSTEGVRRTLETMGRRMYCALLDRARARLA